MPRLHDGTSWRTADSGRRGGVRGPARMPCAGRRAWMLRPAPSPAAPGPLSGSPGSEGPPRGRAHRSQERREAAGPTREVGTAVTVGPGTRRSLEPRRLFFRAPGRARRRSGLLTRGTWAAQGFVWQFRGLQPAVRVRQLTAEGGHADWERTSSHTRVWDLGGRGCRTPRPIRSGEAPRGSEGARSPPRCLPGPPGESGRPPPPPWISWVS